MFNQNPNHLAIFTNLVKDKIANRIIRYSDTLTDCKYLGKPCFVVCITDDYHFLIMNDKDFKGVSTILTNDCTFITSNGYSYLLIKDDTLKGLKFQHDNLFNDLGIIDDPDCVHITLNGISYKYII